VMLPPDDKSAALKPIKWYKQLATREGRVSAGAFLVEGQRAISQIMLCCPNHVLEIVSTSEGGGALRPGCPIRIVTERQMDSISSTRTPQGIIAVVRLPAETYSGQLPVCAGDRVLLLEDVQDPGNVGTLVRTAAAFNFSGVILTENCADPLSAKSVQSTAGAVLSVWLRRTSRYLELVEELKRRGYCFVAADLAGVEDPAVLRDREKLLLALGNEGSGLSNSLLGLADHRLRIATAGHKAESLNVAACGAICMYLSCQR
jgi:TrmH family RNA methyltransferase